VRAALAREWRGSAPDFILFNLETYVYRVIFGDARRWRGSALYSCQIFIFFSDYYFGAPFVRCDIDYRRILSELTVGFYMVVGGDFVEFE